MPHLSRKRLKEDDEKVVKEKLIKVLQFIGKNKYSKYSLHELLSDTEILMLAKRLGIIYLLYKGESMLDICETLNVSSSTVSRIGKIFDRGGYRNLQKIFNQTNSDFLDTLEIILRGGLPNKFGKGRWSFLKD